MLVEWMYYKMIFFTFYDFLRRSNVDTHHKYNFQLNVNENENIREVPQT